MQVSCPECSASLEGAPGSNIVCPACMTPFLVPASAHAVRAFDVMFADGTVAHAMSRHAIREAIYTGRVTAAAKVRHDGRWDIIGGYHEFAAVFRLLGDDLAPLAGTRKLAGWRTRVDTPSAVPIAPVASPNDLPMLRAHLAPPVLPADAPPPKPAASPAPKPATSPKPTASPTAKPGAAVSSAARPRPVAAPPPAASGSGVPAWAWGAGAVVLLGAVAWLVGAGG
jgi:hypothetical protein